MNLTSHVLAMKSRGMIVTGRRRCQQHTSDIGKKKRPEQQSHSNTFAIQLSQQQPSDGVCVPNQSVQKSQESIAARLKTKEWFLLACSLANSNDNTTG